jgi:hypothetical protein
LELVEDIEMEMELIDQYWGRKEANGKIIRFDVFDIDNGSLGCMG